MAVITISRELGSEGDQIAELLCRRLAYDRVDKDVLSKIAQEAGIPPEAILAIEDGVTRRARFTSDEMTSLYRKQSSAFEHKHAIDDQTYLRIVKETMERFADYPENQVKEVEIFLRGPGAGRDAALRAVRSSGVKISLIADVTPIPHNGPRPKKKRRQ